MKKSVLVIGGGPAGITFSRNLKKLQPDAEISMFRPEQYSMVYCAIPYAIEGLFEPSKVFKKDELVTEMGVELIRQSVQSVDLRSKLVVDDAGNSYEYDKLFIATGASPVLPPVGGADASNVFTVKTGNDMAGIIEKVDAGAEKAIVVGAGAIGIEQAQAYSERGIETWLIDMAGNVLPSMVDPDMSKPLHSAIEEKGIHLVLGERVESMSVSGTGGTSLVESVTLSNGEKISLNAEKDFVCFSVGMKPDIDLFRESELQMSNDGIVVDSRMRTSVPDVYAAGDCCTFYSIIDGKPLGGKLATNAVPMAKIAARVVAGLDDEYPGFVNGSATCVEDWRIGSTGFTKSVAESRGLEVVEGHGETTTLFPMMPGADELKVKIIAEKETLRVVGGQILSKLPATDKVDVITLAIQLRLTLRGLSKLSYSAQPWQSFFPARSAIVDACDSALSVVAKEKGLELYSGIKERS